MRVSKVGQRNALTGSSQACKYCIQCKHKSVFAIATHRALLAPWRCGLCQDLFQQCRHDPIMTRSLLMRLPGLIHQYRPLIPTSFPLVQLAPCKRRTRTEAFESSLDPTQLSEARKWRQSVDKESIPKGATTYARSSGPGGQHVNK